MRCRGGCDAGWVESAPRSRRSAKHMINPRSFHTAGTGRSSGRVMQRPACPLPVAPFVREIRLVSEPRDMRELVKMRADVFTLARFNPVVVLLVEAVKREY